MNQIDSVGEYIAMGIPVVNFFVWMGKRIRARRQAKKAGCAVPVNPANVREGVERAKDAAEEVTKAVRARRGLQ